MTILTQVFQECVTNIFDLKIKEGLSRIMDPHQPIYTIENYTTLITSINNFVFELSRRWLEETIKTMDTQFKESNYRKQNYYINKTTSRSLITVFGRINIMRTFYTCRKTNKTYCYVDRKLGLPKYDRYDPCVKSLVVELYANQNSMIKTGQMIGDKIHSLYSLEASRKDFSISRQTVMNILKAYGQVIIDKQERVLNTPSTLYIMADEKYIACQRETSDSQMVKAAVVFEGISQLSPSRKAIDNKFVYLSSDLDFWSDVHEQLYQRYDMKKVKQIYLMGDGASWIKSGQSELKSQITNVSFALDKYHFKKAINSLSNDRNTCTILSDYVINNQKEKFISLTNLIKEVEWNRSKLIEDTQKYILKQWDYIQNAYHIVHVGCPMEQAISHMIASQFSSVPKAYTKSNLSIYLALRNHHLNHYDLRSLYFQAMNTKKEKNIRIISEDYDFSIFEPKSEYYASSVTKWLKDYIT